MKKSALKQSSTKPSIHLKSILIASAIFLTYLLIVGITNLIHNVVEKTTETRKYVAVLEHFLGKDKPSTTLVLFTNNAEMRYGGGFIGSVGLIRAKSGEVKVDPIRSVYYFDHNIDDHPPADGKVEKTPPEFKNLSETMHLRDSGIYLNWQDDAKNAAKYFQMESGVQPDNVVAITPLFLKEILKKTGPIELKDYGITVTPDNLLQTVQLEVESGNDKKAGNDPKTILGVLGSEVLSRLSRQDLKSLLTYGDVLSPMIEQKQIMAYSNDAQTQAGLRQLGLSGELQSFDGNYLLVAEENIAANKSSPFIAQTINQTLTIADNGEAVVDLELTRVHTSDYQHKYTDPHDGKEHWLVGDNTNYAKLALPVGSQLLSASAEAGQVTQVQESGHDSLGFLFAVAPKQTKTVKLSYKLPYHYNMGQRLVVNSLFEKQTGGFEQKIQQRVIVPAGYRLAAASAADVVYNESNPNQAEITTTTNKNYLTSFIYERP